MKGWLRLHYRRMLRKRNRRRRRSVTREEALTQGLAEGAKKVKPALVVNITSMSYTGTTWINMLLGCHREAFALGPPERVISMYEQGWEGACMIHGSECSFWPEFHETYDPNENFYVQLAAASGRRFIVINNPIMANKAGKDLQHPDVLVKNMLVVRDGRAVCRSYRRNNPGKDFYDAVQWFARFGPRFEFDDQDPDVLCVRYEDVAGDQLSAMERLGDFIGLTYPLNFYRFWEFDHHPTAGNAAPYGMILWHQQGRKWGDPRREFYQKEFERLEKEPRKAIFDEGWRTDLSRRELFLFDYYCGETNERWGYERSTFTTSEFEQFRAEIAEAGEGE